MDKTQKSMERLFGRVSPYYDALNRVFSLGIDIYWRKKTVALLDIRDGETILDIATGTGDLAVEALKRCPACRVVGLDLSLEMMRVAAEKRNGRFGTDRYGLLRADALSMPLKDQVFDGIMVSFGVRNIPDVPGLFREAKRVLKKSGRFAVLEFSIPEHAFIRSAYLFYFEKILPWFGEIVSGRTGAYHHLRDSVLGFYRPEEVEGLLRKAGFTVLRSHSLTFGICRVYLARSKSYKGG